MKHLSLYRILISLLLTVIFAYHAVAAQKVSQRTRHKLNAELPILNLSIGDEVLIRTFKKESRLELWMRPQGKSQFLLFRTYPICFYSGDLGPKRQVGDKMTPEGFYAITQRRLNPYSRFHLSMDIGYPNRYDRALGRTGNQLMIHGACDAIGCFAMGNDQIEEIYYLVEQALKKGQKTVAVHAFPFHLSNSELSKMKTHRWYPFWQQLKPAYDAFNRTQIPPTISVKRRRYEVQVNEK